MKLVALMVMLAACKGGSYAEPKLGSAAPPREQDPQRRRIMIVKLEL